MVLPYIAGIFLVFAGMLIGYMLWYRDQSEGVSALHSLRRENEDLRTSLNLAHNSHQNLDERFIRQKGQLNVLQQLCDDWSSNREQGERERAQLEAEVSEKTRRFEEAIEELQVEKKLRIGFEDENHRLAQEQLASLSQLEEDWRSKFSEIESSLFQRQADLKSSTSEKERLTRQLHSAESRVAELQADLANQKSMLESATTNVTGLRQEYTGLEAALSENADLLRQASSDCAAANSAKRVAEDALASLQNNYEAAQLEIQTLQGKVAGLQSLEVQVVSLQEAMSNSTIQLEKVSAQRDTALEAEKTALNRESGMQQRIDNQEATIHSLRSKRDEALGNLKVELEKRNSIEAQLEEKIAALELRLNEETVEMQNQASSFESQAKELADRLEMERSDWKARSLAFGKDLADMANNRDQVAQERSELFEKVQRLTGTLETERNSFASRMGEQASKLEKASHRKAELETELTLIQEALLARESEFEVQAEKESQWQQRLAERSAELEELASMREGMKVELADAHQKLASTETELSDARVELSALREQIEELKTTCQRIVELENLVKQRDDEDSQVTQELRELRDQYADSYAKQQRLQAELERVQAEKHQLASEYGAYDHQVELLRSKLKASEETIRNLRRERAGVLARLANYRTIAEPDATVISFTEAMAQRKQQTMTYDKEYGGHVSQHETRGLVYTEAPETRDDLKRISGIAEVLEGRLNDYGIYTFKQIMEWKPKAIEEFSRLLAFKDRIERDEWLTQARFFYQEKQKVQRSVAA